jgi:hypothetical protein
MTCVTVCWEGGTKGFPLTRANSRFVTFSRRFDHSYLMQVSEVTRWPVLFTFTAENEIVHRAYR